MHLFSNPAFWECVGGAVIALLAAPFVYLLYCAARVAHDAWKGDYQHSASLSDPVFGELRFFKHGCWEGEVTFAAIESGITVLVDASISGPSDHQRALYRQIEQRYNNLLPEIRNALRHYVDNEVLPAFREDFVDYVDHEWEFDLWGIAISDDTDSGRWTAEYNAIDEEDGDMTYSVEMVNWVVCEVTGSD